MGQLTLLMQGEFASDDTTQEILLPAGADYFSTVNQTQAATTQTTGRAVKCEWYNGAAFPADSQLRTFKTDTTNVLNQTFDTSGGFTYYTSLPAQEAAVTGGTAITAASPAVVTMTNTFSDGDRVALYGTTGMRQISGMEFTISSVSGSAFTLLGLPAAGFAAPATAVTARRLPKNKDVLPSTTFVTAITQAANAVVTTSTAHNYVVGQLLNLVVPSSFGMSEASNKTARVVAVATYSVTLDLDSTSFSAFAFPPDTDVPATILFATMAPAGQRNGYNVDQVPFRSGNFVPFMSLKAGVQSPAGSTTASVGDNIFWQAWKKEN